MIEQGLRHLVLMKVDSDEQLNQVSENGWFVFAADNYGVIKVYCIRKGQSKYSLYTSMQSEDKSEILKIRYIQLNDIQSYLIVLKEKRIEIWEWPKKQLFDYILLSHKALDIAQYNYKSQALYGVLESNRTKNSLEYSVIELMQFEPLNSSDQYLAITAKASTKNNGKFIIKNTFNLSNLNNPQNVQCIRILDDPTQEKPKYVLSYENIMYITDHTG